MRRVLIGSVILLVLVVLAGDQILERLPFERLRPILEQQLSEGVGLEVRLAGDLHAGLLPVPHFEAEEIAVANLPGRPSPHLLEIGRVDLEFQLWPLVRRKVVIDSIRVYDAELRIEPDEEGEFSLSPNPDELDEPAADPDAEGTELHLAELYVENLRVFYDRVGEDDVTTLVFDVVSLEAADLMSPVTATITGDYEGGAFELAATLGPFVELLNPTRPFPIELEGRVLETDLQLSGTLVSPTRGKGVDLGFSARLDDLARVLPDADPRIARLGRVDVSGRLADPDGLLGVRELVVRTDADAPVQLVLEGSVRDVRAFSGVELRLRAESDDPRFFEELTGTPLPDLPVLANLTFSDDDGSLGTEGDAHVGGDGPVTLDVRGVLDDLRQLSELDVSVDLSSRELRAIQSALELDFDQPLPNLSPVAFHASLRDHEGTFGLDDIRATAGRRETVWVEVTGSVRDALGFAGLELEGRMGAADVQALAASMDREIPKLGAVEASALFSDLDGTLGIERLSAKGGRAGLFEFEVAGAFDDLVDLDEIEAEARFEARDLTVIGNLAELELPPIGPVSFTGRVRGSDERLHSEGRARLNRTTLEGEWTAVFAPELRRSFSGRLSSPHVFLQDVGIQPGAQRPDLVEREGPSAFARWWARGEPAPTEALREIDLDVAVEIDRVTGQRDLVIEDVQAHLRLDQGDLVLRDAGGGYEGGRVQANVRVDARRSEPVYSLKLQTFNIDLTTLMSQFQEDTEYAGKLDLSVDLKSRGRTRRQVVSRLNGHFGAMLRDGAMVNRYSRAFSVSFLRASIPSFRGGGGEERPVKCLLGLLPIEAGVAEADVLFLEGDKITVTGTGSIDLAANELDLRLTPHLHEPGLVSVAVTVDVAGPLENPRLRPVARSLGSSLIRGVFRNAMRPGRDLARRLRRGEVDVEDPCDVVRLRRESELAADEIEDGRTGFEALYDER